MDQGNQTQVQSQPQAPPVQPATPPPPMPPAQQSAPQQQEQVPPPQKKSQAWIWILGGCLGIVILGIVALVVLGWWGARKVKREMEKITPNLEEMKKNADKWNEETEEWQKKSEDFRDKLPNPEDMPAPEGYPESYPMSQ